MMNVFEDCESAKHVAIWYHHKKEKVINQKIRTYIKDVGEMPDEAYIRRGYADLAGDLRRLGADCRAGRTGTEAGRQTKKL